MNLNRAPLFFNIAILFFTLFLFFNLGLLICNPALGYAPDLFWFTMHIS